MLAYQKIGPNRPATANGILMTITTNGQTKKITSAMIEKVLTSIMSK